MTRRSSRNGHLPVIRWCPSPPRFATRPRVPLGQPFSERQSPVTPPKLLPLLGAPSHPGGRSAMTCRYRCGDACAQPVPNESGNEYFADRSEEHTSELQSLMCISYAVFCLKKKIDEQITDICSIHS